MEMGAQMSYTCAPYLLDSKPSLGEQVVWAESNAVVYANSVLGARTLKYPDYLDICIALTGRAPNVGSHRDEGRLAPLRIDVALPAGHAFWNHPKIAITPHTSARTLREDSLAQMIAKLQALARGEPLTGVVEGSRGY